MNLQDFRNGTIETEKFLNDHTSPLIYRLHDVLNNKDYVGYTKDLRDRLYNSRIGHVNSLYKDIPKKEFIHIVIEYIGEEYFELYVEEEFKTEKEAYDRESYWVQVYDSFNNGYNKTSDGKGGTSGTVAVHKGSEHYRISPNELDNYLKKGFSKGLGRKVVTNPKTGKFYRVYSDEAEELIKNFGYIEGSKVLSTTKGRISIYNEETGKSKKILPSELSNYLESGWKQGFRANSGNLKYYNPDTGNIVFVSDPDKIKELVSQGYLKGCPKYRGNYIMNDGKNQIYVSESEKLDYMNKGFIFGPLNKQHKN